MHSWLLPALVGGAIILRLLYSTILTIQHAWKARRLGCSSAPLYPTRDPFGISTLMETVRADRAKMLPPLAEKRIDMLSRQHERYVSTFRLQTPGRQSFFTVDPKNIQAMLATQFSDFGHGHIRGQVAEPVVGHGIFTVDGQAWSRSRSLLRPQFTRMQLNNLEREETHMQNAFKAIPPALASGWTPAVDIQTIFFRLTIDSSTEVLFGKSCDSQITALNPDLSADADSFLHRFDKCVWYLGERLRMDKLYWMVNTREFRECTEMVHDFVDQYVYSALKETPAQEKRPEQKDSEYVFLKAMAETNRDPLELRFESLNVLLAGRDTTASLLSWCMQVLARRADIFNRLRNEILEQFGTYSEPHNLDFASLKSCQYLQHFINETMRLYPVVPFNRRVALKDTKIPTGGGKDGLSPVYIKKGQPVLYSTYVLQRRKDIWGEDADSFNPDRWAGRRVTWEFIPFNGGPRTCIGQQFALVRASYVLVRLLQRFDAIEDVYPERPLRFGVTLTSCPAELVTVRFHESRV